MNVTRQAYRAAILHSVGDPSSVGVAASYEYFADGLLVVENGVIQALGAADDVLLTLAPGTPVHRFPDALLTPGFVDTHIHLPQVGMLGAYGEDLLHWLNTYTFACESQFADPAHCERVAEIFTQELLRNGTTTAMVFGSVHAASVEAFFQQAERLNLRMIAGKTWMDRNAPAELLDTPQSAYADSQALIRRWHGRGRLHYAVTPRFAPTSSPEQLALAGQLLQEFPDLYLQTHLSENIKELAWVHELFPERDNYLDVYDHYRLLGERSVFAHGVHLCDSECARLASSGSALAFCPTSNLFLGSGLFDLAQAERFAIPIGLGTDVGGGTSFSMLQTLNEAYKVQQLRGTQVHPMKLFYLATLGGAKALRLDAQIGNLQVGSEADFIVLDYRATPLLTYRLEQSNTIEERLFALMTLGDDRVIKETWAAGQLVHRR